MVFYGRLSSNSRSYNNDLSSGWRFGVRLECCGQYMYGSEKSDICLCQTHVNKSRNSQAINTIIGNSFLIQTGETNLNDFYMLTKSFI